MNNPDELANKPDAPFVLKGVAEVTQVSQLTGPDSPNRTDRYDVHATDLGSMFAMEDRMYFVFGDTFGRRPPGKTGSGGEHWRSNVLAYSTDMDPADGITFDGMITGPKGMAKEVLHSKKVRGIETTKIPTYGFAVGTDMYLHYQSIKDWGESSQWTANYSGLAKSTDKGNSWTFLDNVKWPGSSNFMQVSIYAVQISATQKELYFWSIPNGRHGGVKLMKVDEKEVEQLDKYVYFSGTDKVGNPIWSSDMSNAKTIVEDTVGGLSVVWNPYLQRWIMTYLSPAGGGPVVIREGITPWGPWGQRIIVATQAQYPKLYAPYMHSKYVENNGETVYFTLSRWDPYNVYWNKMKLLKQDDTK
jgi:hypothetical protein